MHRKTERCDAEQGSACVAGLFDMAKEVARLNKQREKAEKDLAGVTSRMANKKFMDNAPPQVTDLSLPTFACADAQDVVMHVPTALNGLQDSPSRKGLAMFRM